MSASRWRRLAARGVRALALLIATVVAFALLFPVGYALLAAVPAPPAVELPATGAGDTGEIYVADWGYHTSITVPQPRGWSVGPSGREDAPWLEYAWGDRAFYRDMDYRPQAVFATVALPTPTVVYLVGRAAPPGGGAKAVFARRVGADTLRALVAELERSIRHDAQGRRVAPAPPNGRDAGRYYDAWGSYLWTRDCNRWTLDRLAAVGLATGGRGVVLSSQVAGRLRGFRRLPPA